MTVMSSLSRTLTGPERSRIFRLDGDFHLNEMESAVMRVGFAILIFLSIKWETGNLTMVKPEDAVGLAKFFDLTFLSRMGTTGFWKWLTAMSLAAYAAGRLPALTMLPALFFAVGIGTLNASQGAHNHSTQLCTMILIGQWFVYALPLGTRGGVRLKNWLTPDLQIHRRAFQVSLIIFAACYVVSALVKLQNSDWLWFYRVVPGLAVELQKTNWSAYYDTLEPVPQVLATTVNLMNEHPWMARLFFGAGLLIELFAFVIVLGRRWAFFMGLAIVIMHLSISHLMQLDFWYHIWAAVIFLLNFPGVSKTFRAARRDGLL